MQQFKQLVVFTFVLFLSIAEALASGPAVQFSTVPTITGPLVVGQTYTYQYELTGITNLPTQLSLTIAPSNHSPSLGITENNCQVAPKVGESCSFKLVIRPTTAGLINDSINVHLNGRENFSPAPSAVEVATITNLAYVTNYSAHSVSTCTIATDGGLTGCSSTSMSRVFSNPVAIALNPARTFAYLTSDNDNNIYQCNLSNNTTITNQCTTTGSGFSKPYSIAFNAFGTLAYVANESAGTISKCVVGNNGAFSSCIDSGANGLGTPFAVTLNPQGTIAYIADTDKNKIFECTVGSDGQLSGCADAVSGYTLSNPSAIAFNHAGTYAYVVDYGHQQVVKFSVQAGGSLTNGNIMTISSLIQPYGIALFQADSTHTFAYVTDQGYHTTGATGATFSCAVNNQGNLENCSNTPVTINFDFPLNIFI